MIVLHRYRMTFVGEKIELSITPYSVYHLVLARLTPPPTAGGSNLKKRTVDYFFSFLGVLVKRDYDCSNGHCGIGE